MILEKRRKVRLAANNGVRMPSLLFDAAEWARIPYWVACAFAMQETSGGKNIYGQDGGPDHPFYKHGTVTECNYKTYRKEARRTGKRQGVGPLQLTHASFQDRADELGGCWKPYHNMQAAFEWMRGRRTAGQSWHDIARGYNGQESYAVEMDGRFELFRKLFKDEDGDT